MHAIIGLLGGCYRISDESNQIACCDLPALHIPRSHAPRLVSVSCQAPKSKLHSRCSPASLDLTAASSAARCPAKSKPCSGAAHSQRTFRSAGFFRSVVRSHTNSEPSL